MAQILHQVVAGEGMLALWYHYAILFEALFILTTVDAGTRVGRFLIQDPAGMAWAPLGRTDWWLGNVLATGLCVSAWGYFLYQGVVDPLGGINTLWPLFGIAHQMLAAIALSFACVCLVKIKRERYLWIPLLPTVWLIICTMTAGWQKLFHEDVRIGFLSHARLFSDALAAERVLAPARSLADMERVVRYDYVNAGLTVVLMSLVVAMVFFGMRAAIKGWHARSATTMETVRVAI